MTKHLKVFLSGFILGLCLTYVFASGASEEIIYIDEAKYNDQSVDKLVELELPQ